MNREVSTLSCTVETDIFQYILQFIDVTYDFYIEGEKQSDFLLVMCRLLNRAFDATVSNATQASVNQSIPNIRIRFDNRQYLEAEGAIREKAEEREWNGTES
jgi:hypothetical protein